MAIVHCPSPVRHPLCDMYAWIPPPMCATATSLALAQELATISAAHGFASTGAAPSQQCSSRTWQASEPTSSYPSPLASQQTTAFRRWTVDGISVGPERELVPGLRSALRDAGLSSYSAAAEKWCLEEGAAFLMELVEELDALSEALFGASQRASDSERKVAEAQIQQLRAALLAHCDCDASSAGHQAPPVASPPSRISSGQGPPPLARSATDCAVRRGGSRSRHSCCQGGRPGPGGGGAAAAAAVVPAAAASVVVRGTEVDLAAEGKRSNFPSVGIRGDPIDHYWADDHIGEEEEDEEGDAEHAHAFEEYVNATSCCESSIPRRW